MAAAGASERTCEDPAPVHEEVAPAAAEHAGERVEPPVRGESILRAADSVFVRLDAWIGRALPEELNPLAQTGAIANTTFLVAVVSGIVLLLWYSSSVRLAYDSVSAMAAAPWTAQLARSVHRYSSDACMCFVVLHALKLFFQRRFGGARWLAWLTGAFLVATLWLVGWLGYWLVWDERARQVALGTARLLDALPIFADPLSRSFLSDEDVGSLLFFIVFFVHMLIPLAMGVALWLHITRLSRPHFLTRWPLTLWILGALAAASFAFPADVAHPAHMGVVPAAFRIDAWYLLPLALTDRLRAGALWAAFLAAGVLVWSVPWSLARGRARVAHVDAARCNACTLCYQDCPYDAIQMVPRTDGRAFPTQAQVDPKKCIGCGICAGSCDAAGIGLVWFDAVRKRAQMDRFVDAAVQSGDKPMVAFVCEESAGHGLAIDEARATCDELPGYRVMRVPCAGWVHALTVERALRHGAAGVLVAACGAGSQMYREGGIWTRARMGGAREPVLNRAKVDPSRVRVIEAYRGDVARLSREAAVFRTSRHAPQPDAARTSRVRVRVRVAVAGAVLAALFAALVVSASRLGYALPPGDGSELVLSFKHPGAVEQHCRDRTPEELQKLPAHMRQPQVCERRRVWVRMRAYVDGARVVDGRYEPKGLWDDGNSLALERLPVAPGRHLVRVEIGDTGDADDWDHVEERTLDFERRGTRVVTFDKVDGFRWR
jgi:coenzyme F420-reducing hydrogenase delta subunit/NAD-dependent dihydropyrimidine dehydrogenase PreA subunit